MLKYQESEQKINYKQSLKQGNQAISRTKKFIDDLISHGGKYQSDDKYVQKIKQSKNILHEKILKIDAQNAKKQILTLEQIKKIQAKYNQQAKSSYKHLIDVNLSKICQKQCITKNQYMKIIDEMLLTKQVDNNDEYFNKIKYFWKQIQQIYPHNPQNVYNLIQSLLELSTYPQKQILSMIINQGLYWGQFRVIIWFYIQKQIFSNQLFISKHSILLNIIRQGYANLNSDISLKSDILDILQLIHYNQDIRIIDNQKYTIMLQNYLQANNFQTKQIKRQQINEQINKKIQILYQNILQSPYSSQSSKYQSFIQLAQITYMSNMIGNQQTSKLYQLRQKSITQFSGYLHIFQNKIKQSDFISYKKYQKRLKIISMKNTQPNNSYDLSQSNTFLQTINNDENSCQKVMQYIVQNLSIKYQPNLQFYELTVSIVQKYFEIHRSWWNNTIKFDNYYNHPHLSTSCNLQEHKYSLPAHIWTATKYAIKLANLPKTQLSDKINKISKQIISKFYNIYEKQFMSVYFMLQASKYSIFQYAIFSNIFNIQNQYYNQFVYQRSYCVRRGYQLLKQIDTQNNQFKKQKSSCLQQLISVQFYRNMNHPIIKSQTKSGFLLTFIETRVHNPQIHSIDQSNFYRNHWTDCIYGKFLIDCQQIILKKVQQHQQLPYIQMIQQNMFRGIKWLKEHQANINHNNELFYQSFRVYKYLYIFVDLIILSWNKENKLNKIEQFMEQILLLMGTGNIHPLMRQYISVILAKAYFNSPQINKKYKDIFISKLKSQYIDLNKFVPILLIIGYQMVSLAKLTTQNAQNQAHILFKKLLQFISCHHAYIRSICQYYISKYIQIIKSMPKQKDFGFLQYLCFKVWKYDKDCIKIMKNIGIVVQGFKEVIESNKVFEYLGFERVEQYPTNVIINQLRNDYELIKKYQKQTNQYCKELISDQRDQENTNNSLGLQIRYRKPDIIIIASLLEKVHNFGHILRTMHHLPNNRQGKSLNIMVVVPSKQPLQHLQCQQLIPKNSQIHIVQIKPEDLKSFIKLNKQNYPLIALEQCANSVKIQQFNFPKSYMLLLGNQRIGAPASLLNQAQFLIQIPQVGKVRSLNVHVSMVICIWQGIACNYKKQE